MALILCFHVVKADTEGTDIGETHSKLQDIAPTTRDTLMVSVVFNV